MTLQAILLYLAVGYFVDRCIENTGYYDEGDEDGVVGLRWMTTLVWPGMGPGFLVYKWIIYQTERPTKHRAAARPTSN